jgi:hypothetical protein
MSAPIDTLIAKLIGSLEAKKMAIEEALQALRVIKECAYLLPPEEAKRLLHDAYMQSAKQESPSQGSLFPPSDPSCEAIEAEEEAKEERARTYYARIVAYFLSTDNKDSTTAEIREATKLTRSALSAILYRTHSRFFLRSTRPGYERMTLWHMEPVAYEAVRHERDSVKQRQEAFKKGNEAVRDTALPVPITL